MKVLSIIIPVFNEENTIEAVLKRAIEQRLNGWKKEIIVVDDGSTDSTRFKIHDLGFKNSIRIIRKGENKGRGSAVRTGIKACNGDAILFQDADLEYDPADWQLLLEMLESSKSKVVYGSRIKYWKRKRYISYYIGNRVMTSITNLLFGSRLTDVYTGYKLFDSKFLKSLTLISRGFELEAEITAQTLCRHEEIKEVSIQYAPRSFQEGKKIYYNDGITGLLMLVRCRFAYLMQFDRFSNNIEKTVNG